MSVDLNNALANVLLTLYATEMPAGSTLAFRTGPVAGAENADTGTLLVSVTSPASPWSAAASGAMTKNGTWSGVGVAAGTIAHYRFSNAAGTRIEEGSVTATSGGGDIEVDNAIVAINQVVTVTSFTKTL